MIAAETEAARIGLGELQAALHQAAALALRSAVEAAEKDAKGTTLFRDRSGDTRASIHGTVTGARGEVSAHGVAKLLENGTVAHQIVARRAAALHFFVNGREFFRRMVQHPGTSERPFMAHARTLGEQALEYGMDYFVGFAIERAGA